MSRRGRFGKFGESKRLERLRRSGTRSPFDPASRLRRLNDRIRHRHSGSHGPSLRVRDAYPSDLRFIEDLSGRVFGIYGPYREWIARWFQSDSTITLVALMAEKPAGFAMLGRFSNPSAVLLSAELLAIAVEPARQRAGAGRALMSEIEEISASLGVRRIFLHTAKENLAAQALFKSFHFTPAEFKQRFYPAGQDAVEMVKDLL